MAGLQVTQAQADAAIAAKNEMINVFEEGAYVGAVEVIPDILNGDPFTPDPTNTAGEDYSSGTAVAIIRAIALGPVPVGLPSYTVAQLATLPPASYPHCMIYVSNEAGGAVPAFSDGSNWRRVTDRNVVS